VQELAQKYTIEAIEGLYKIASNVKSPAQARVAAWNSILDRGHGKPSLAVDLTHGPRTFDGIPEDELVQTLAAIESFRTSSEGSGGQTQ
jgi:hypothetical protein